MHPESTAFILFHLLCFDPTPINSGSTLWKLSSDKTKIIDGTDIHSKVSLFETTISNEAILDIISSTVFHGETWLKQGNEKLQKLQNPENSVENSHDKDESRQSSKCHIAAQTNSEDKPTIEVKPPTKSTTVEEGFFDCGKPVNFTHYDNLMGVYNRFILPNVTKPQSASVFGYHTHNEVDNETTLMIDFSDYIKFLIRCIRKARIKKTPTAPLYNFLGNYWQLKGYSLKSIECFRKGLSISPHNARILLNLARLLFSLQYLDDAIYLTKRSLEMEQIQNGVWIHHFTLGEIFKAYGLYQEATVHLNHSLKLKPDLTVARLILQQISGMHLPDQIHSYTIFIIVLLALLVVAIILLLHKLPFDLPTERHVIRITEGSARYFRNFRRNQKFRKSSV